MISCEDHRLDLEVNYTTDQHPDLKTIIDSVHDTMKIARHFENVPLLRNLTTYKPILFNYTR